MKDKENDASKQRVWPFKASIAVICVPMLLVVLLFIIYWLESSLDWPGEGSRNLALIGALLISILPILLLLIDTIVERGGRFEFSGVKLDFSSIEQKGNPGFTIEANIGEKGVPINESNVVMILDSLRKATMGDVVIIDLEDGQAWWETRLFVLLAGAERLKKPGKVVFVTTDGKEINRFIGWAYSKDLFERLLTQNLQYESTFIEARAAALQWSVAEPFGAANINDLGVYWPKQFPWLIGKLTDRHGNMAFDNATGKHSEMFQEKLIARELGEKIESVQVPDNLYITVSGLNKLFGDLLFWKAMEQGSSAEEQLSVFFESQEPFIAVTHHTRFVSLVSKMSVFNDMLKQLTTNKK